MIVYPTTTSGLGVATDAEVGADRGKGDLTTVTSTAMRNYSMAMRHSTGHESDGRETGPACGTCLSVGRLISGSIALASTEFDARASNPARAARARRQGRDTVDPPGLCCPT